MKIFFWVATFLVTFLAVASHRQSSRGVQAFRKPSRLSNQFKPRILNNRKPAKLIKQAQLASKQRARKPIIRKVQRRLLRQKRPQRKSAHRYSAFLNECLAGHNRVRRAHNLPYLVLDPFLVQSAQRSANYIASRPNYPLDHNYPELAQAGLGENLTRGYPTCQSAINGWAGEVSIYNSIHRPAIDGNNPDFKRYGHYTQLVWDSTRRVGCAMSNSNSGVVIACRYDPPGNRHGEKPF